MDVNEWKKELIHWIKLEPKINENVNEKELIFLKDGKKHNIEFPASIIKCNKYGNYCLSLDYYENDTLHRIGGPSRIKYKIKNGVYIKQNISHFVNGRSITSMPPDLPFIRYYHEKPNIPESDVYYLPGGETKMYEYPLISDVNVTDEEEPLILLSQPYKPKPRGKFRFLIPILLLVICLILIYLFS